MLSIYVLQHKQQIVWGKNQLFQDTLVDLTIIPWEWESNSCLPSPGYALYIVFLWMTKKWYVTNFSMDHSYMSRLLCSDSLMNKPSNMHSFGSLLLNPSLVRLILYKQTSYSNMNQALTLLWVEGSMEKHVMRALTLVAYDTMLSWITHTVWK